MATKVLLILSISFIFFFSPDIRAEVELQPHSSVGTLFSEELATEIDGILTDTDNRIGQIRIILIRVLYFLLFFWTIVDFIIKGFSAEKTVNGFLMAFTVALLNETYILWTDGLYYLFSEAAMGIQEAVVGEDSKYFLSTYTTNLLDKLDFVDVGIFDGAYKLFLFFSFMVLKTILAIGIYLAEIWAIWGFSFAQLIGPFFIPFIILPATRPLFDKWFALLLTFCLFTFVFRTIGVLFAIFTNSLLGSPNYTATIDGVIVLTDWGPQFIQIIVYLALGILMLLGAGNISAQLAGGVGASGMSNKAMGGAKKLFTKLVA